jgi:glycosyltransferase involved in cell wall biosynthesis
MLVTVAICTFNRSASLRATLQSLAGCAAVPHTELEVLIVDNNSTDDTAGVVREFMQTATLEVRYLFEGAQGLSNARNAAIRSARGEIISFIDDDVILPLNWLFELTNAFRQFDAACVGGRVFLSPTLRLPKWWRKEYDAPLGKFDRGDQTIVSDSTNREMIGIGANLSFRRVIFDKCGAFSTTHGRTGTKLLMGEETELIDRLLDYGERAIYCPACFLYHSPGPQRMTSSYLRRWYFRMGEWESAQNSSSAVSWFGIPRWVYGSAVSLILKLLASTLTLQSSAMRYCQFRLFFLAGFATGVNSRNAYAPKRDIRQESRPPNS